MKNCGQNNSQPYTTGKDAATGKQFQPNFYFNCCITFLSNQSGTNLIHISEHFEFNCYYLNA